MKILQTLSLLLLLVLLALGVATWDMQRREAAAKPVDTSALQPQPPAPPAVCSVCGGKRWVEVTLPPENCRTCQGTGHYQSGVNAGLCPFCKGTGKITQTNRIPCPACGGTAATPTPVPPGTNVPATNHVAPKLVLCPTCNGAKFVSVTEPCRNCGGTGIFKDRASFSKGTTCIFCKGTGKISKQTNEPCPTCKGRGFAEQAASVPPPAGS